MIQKLLHLLRGGSGKAVGAGKPGAAAPSGSGSGSPRSPQAARSPETLCGIDPKKMDREEIRRRLAELFRRHNAAEASLHPELREEARLMLDAIVACRQKYVDGGR